MVPLTGIRISGKILKERSYFHLKRSDVGREVTLAAAQAV